MSDHQRPWRRYVWVLGTSMALVGLLSAGAAVASHSFVDVSDNHVFHEDIEWMKDSGITVGCNPPQNTEYCPERFTSRGEMAAFFHRFAESRTVDAGWLEGHTADDFLGVNDKAADSDLLDGKDSTDFLGVNDKAADSDLLDGKDSTEFVTHTEVTDFVSKSDVTLREADENSGLIVVGNSYTALCEPGELAIGGGYDAEFVLVDTLVDDLGTGALGPVLALLNLDGLLPGLSSALDGVSNVNVSGAGPVQVGGDWGWEINSTVNLASDITVRVLCAA